MRYLIFILILAGFLRIYNITNQGLFLHDEGAFWLVVKTPYEALQFLLERLKEHKNFDFKELADYLSSEGGIISNDAKPGYFLLFFILSLLTKLGDFTAKLLSAVFGILTIFFLYKLILNLYNNKNTALIAAFLLAILPIHIFYSRIGIANEIASCLSIIGLYLYTKSVYKNSLKSLIFSGVVFGYAFTCHYYIFYQLILLFFYEIISQKKINIRILYFSLGFLVFPFLFEIISKCAVTYLKALPYIKKYNIPLLSYSEQLLFQLTKRIHYEPFYNIFLFPRLNLYLNGYIFFFFLMVGLLYFLYRTCLITRNLPDIIILSQFLLPLILWTVFKYQVGRNFVVVLPASCVMLALFINSIKWHGNILKPIFLCLLFVLGIKGAYGVIILKSGYKEAVQYLSKLDTVKHISTQDPICQVYLGMDNVSYPKGEDVGELIHYAKSRGFRYLLVDYVKYSPRYKIVLELEKKLPKIAVFDNNLVGSHLGILCEVYPEKTISQIIRKKNILSQIKIYKIY